MTGPIAGTRPEENPCARTGSAPSSAPESLLAVPAAAIAGRTHWSTTGTGRPSSTTRRTPASRRRCTPGRATASTRVRLMVTGLPPNATFGAHVHTGPCGAGPARRPVATTSTRPTRRSRWPSARSGSTSPRTTQGRAVSADHRARGTIAPGTAGSVVIHALPTNPTTGVAGARLAVHGRDVRRVSQSSIIWNQARRSSGRTSGRPRGRCRPPRSRRRVQREARVVRQRDARRPRCACRRRSAGRAARRTTAGRGRDRARRRRGRPRSRGSASYAALAAVLRRLGVAEHPAVLVGHHARGRRARSRAEPAVPHRRRHRLGVEGRVAGEGRAGRRSPAGRGRRRRRRYGSPWSPSSPAAADRHAGSDGPRADRTRHQGLDLGAARALPRLRLRRRRASSRDRPARG